MMISHRIYLFFLGANAAVFGTATTRKSNYDLPKNQFHIWYLIIAGGYQLFDLVSSSQFHGGKSSPSLPKIIAEFADKT